MRILGLDIGTTSIGFALIDLDTARETGAIVRLGVRIFPEARDPDGTPLNQTRRAKRMMRRQLRRRRERRRSLNEMLSDNGLLPKFGGDDWRAAMGADPYALRAKGLAEALTPHELGRALYHLSKRRHFKERDLAEIGDNEAAPELDETAEAKPGKKAKAAPKIAAPDDEVKSTEARKHMVEELKPEISAPSSYYLAIRRSRARCGISASKWMTRWQSPNRLMSELQGQSGHALPSQSGQATVSKAPLADTAHDDFLTQKLGRGVGYHRLFRSRFSWRMAMIRAFRLERGSALNTVRSSFPRRWRFAFAC